MIVFYGACSQFLKAILHIDFSMALNVDAQVFCRNYTLFASTAKMTTVLTASTAVASLLQYL
jgi:hypothetical protein